MRHDYSVYQPSIHDSSLLFSRTIRKARDSRVFKFNLLKSQFKLPARCTKYQASIRFEIELFDKAQVFLFTWYFLRKFSTCMVSVSPCRIESFCRKKSKLLPSYNNMAGRCKLVQQLIKCSI